MSEPRDTSGGGTSGPGALDAGQAGAGPDGFVEIAGGRLHVRHLPATADAALASPLVFLHEGLGSVDLWRSFPDAVRMALGGPEMLVYSRHGYGRSAVHPGPRDVDYLHREALDVLPALLEDVGVARPLLVGHSDGASIALIHAAGRPVAGLVLIAPHVFVEDCTVAAIAAAGVAYATTDLGRRMARHHDDADATFRGWNDVWLSPAFRSWNIEAGLPAITAPVLLVQGDADEYGTLAQLGAIERAVAGPTSRIVVASAGHSPHLSHGPDVVAAVARFAATCVR